MVYHSLLDFYIDGRWVRASGQKRAEIWNPATASVIGELALAEREEVDNAVLAARRAFPEFTVWPVSERIALLERLLLVYESYREEIAEAISLEMGAPLSFARKSQFAAGSAHLRATIEAAKVFPWEIHRNSSSLLLREGIGVCALITPWNWPMNQISCKVAPALVSGCTMVLKPSEKAPLSAALFAQVCDSAGVPKGVFNLLNGIGSETGSYLASHPDVDMVSFTGSTHAGTEVARAAASTVKRLSQELGGKSPNILLPSCDLRSAVRNGVRGCFENAGQSCDAPSRMFVPRLWEEQAFEYAKLSVEEITIGNPGLSVEMGPLANLAQFEKVQSLIRKGIQEGALLVVGGDGHPVGLDQGWFVKPTVFGRVRNDMTIAREEIFGPVLCIIAYNGVDEAVSMANDTVYGLSAYVQGNIEEAQAVARQLRAGQVCINAPVWDASLPFGGYKRSGNGREYGEWGIDSFCETKVLIRG